MTGSERRHLTSVATAARVLREFGRGDTQLGVSQLARRVGVGKSTAHRVVWTLVDEFLLEKVPETGLFRLSPTMRALGASAETAQRLHEAATSALDWLRTVTDGTLHVAILDGADVLYVERREGPGKGPMFRMVGGRNNAHVTSTGKVLLAYLPAEEQHAVVQGLRLPMRTVHTITKHADFLAELERVRHQGYAENRWEAIVGMCSIATPVRDLSGRVIAAVSVAAPADREQGLRVMLRHLTRASAIISASFGGPS